jgi:hypothetical protein
MSVQQTKLNSELAKQLTNALLKDRDAMYALGYLESLIATEMDVNPKLRDRVLSHFLQQQRRVS